MIQDQSSPEQSHLAGPPKFLERAGKAKLAYHYTAPENENTPTILFCPGFRSDMEGTKALFLENLARQNGFGFLRFDYSGHGQSGGDFKDGTIGSWFQDTLDLVKNVTEGPLIIIGSSMGGWIALLSALNLKDRVKAVIGIAAAPDFTKDMYHNHLDDSMRAQMQKEGFTELPNEYSDEPYIITRNLIEDGEKHCLLHKTIDLDIPVCLIQGMQDHAVEWKHAHRIRKAMKDPENTTVVMIEDGDHSLSRDSDLQILEKAVLEAVKSGKNF